MRLKSLELVGFKSFFEPTTISFASGITAVVGPNGCGKSNVVDAIRWILGEQAPTRLRGKTTEDLVYAGNDQNPAAGMAEVSLVLDAEDGGPPGSKLDCKRDSVQLAANLGHRGSFVIGKRKTTPPCTDAVYEQSGGRIVKNLSRCLPWLFRRTIEGSKTECAFTRKL